MPRLSSSAASSSSKLKFKSRAAMNSHFGACWVVSSTAAFTSAESASPRVMPLLRKPENLPLSVVSAYSSCGKSRCMPSRQPSRLGTPAASVSALRAARSSERFCR